MWLFKKFVGNTRKPEGFLGAMMISGMNFGHARVSDWGMGHFPKLAPQRIADLGCGGGRNAAELLKRYTKAIVTAVDYSPLSVKKAKAYNREHIEAGRCIVQEGDVAALDLPDEAFDLATAFETIYFWPGPEECFREVRRILKHGGYFMIVNESSDGTDAESLKYEKIIEGTKNYTLPQITEYLQKAGFTEVWDVHHSEKPWIVVAAKK